MQPIALAEMLLKMQTLFFFLQDLDEDCEDQSGPAREIVDKSFAKRYRLSHDEVSSVLPWLQAKTLVWFLFPILSVLHSPTRKDLLFEPDLPSDPPTSWKVTIKPKSRSATVATQLTTMRHALAHMLEGTAGATGVDLDEWSFTADRGRTVSFEDLDGFTACLSDLLEYATAYAGRIVREDKRIRDAASNSVLPSEPE